MRDDLLPFLGLSVIAESLSGRAKFLSCSGSTKE